MYRPQSYPPPCNFVNMILSFLPYLTTPSRRPVRQARTPSPAAVASTVPTVSVTTPTTPASTGIPTSPFSAVVDDALGARCGRRPRITKCSVVSHVHAFVTSHCRCRRRLGPGVHTNTTTTSRATTDSTMTTDAEVSIGGTVRS